MKSLFNLLVILTIVAVIIAVTMVAGCNSPEQKVENAQENLNKAEQDLTKKQVDSANDYQVMKTYWENQMNDNERKIEELQTEKSDKKVEVEKSYNAKIADLRRQNDEMRTKMNNYQYSTADTKWNEFKDGFNKDMKKLGDDITDLKDKIAKKIKKD
jgi:outer membrane murein-binding lipoprotein Lpp